VEQESGAHEAEMRSGISGRLRRRPGTPRTRSTAAFPTPCIQPELPFLISDPADGATSCAPRFSRSGAAPERIGPEAVSWKGTVPCQTQAAGGGRCATSQDAWPSQSARDLLFLHSRFALFQHSTPRHWPSIAIEFFSVAFWGGEATLRDERIGWRQFPQEPARCARAPEQLVCGALLRQ
jgi:hypothetical protein